jgi:nitroreductase
LKTRGMENVMQIPFDVAKTINSRRSARSFKAAPLKPDILGRLWKFAKAIDLPFACGTEIRFFKAEPTKKLYPLMQSPKDNVAFISETDVVSIAKTGFCGELVILMAESLGVSTCWYGHYRLAELERLMPHLQDPGQLEEANMGYGYSKGVTDGVRAICISPLGYYEERGLRLMDRITKSSFSFKRKGIAALLENPKDMDNLSEDICYALDLARKAPSAANAQMWRFGFEDDYKTMRVAMPVGYKHFKWEHPNVEIGICACHIWLGLLDREYTPAVEVTEDRGRAVFRIHV